MTYNLHLERRANDELRVSQLDEVLSDSACYGPQRMVVVAGDLNLDVSKTPTTPPRRLFETGRQTIDWAFVHGPIEIAGGQIHKPLHASDHYPLSFNLIQPEFHDHRHLMSQRRKDRSQERLTGYKPGRSSRLGADSVASGSQSGEPTQ